MTKTLILLRHAHRDVIDPSADNSLSKKGRAQAEAVLRFYKDRFGKDGALLLSSPKKRCLQTLDPLAEMLASRVKTDERLLEGPWKLEVRVREFLSWWKASAPPRTVACSHGDWIPEFTRLAVGQEVPLRGGGWVEMTLEGDIPRLDAVLQDLPS